MLQRIMEGLGQTTGAAMRLGSLAIVTGVALFLTACFLCAAAFVAVFQKYGLIAACLTGALMFFLATLIAAGSYVGYKRALRRRAAAARQAAQEAAKTSAQSLLSDPVLLATALQLVRTVGVKRLLPILAVGGLALGFLASRSLAAGDASAEAAE